MSLFCVQQLLPATFIVTEINSEYINIVIPLFVHVVQCDAHVGLVAQIHFWRNEPCVALPVLTCIDIVLTFHIVIICIEHPFVHAPFRVLAPAFRHLIAVECLVEEVVVVAVAALFNKCRSVIIIGVVIRRSAHFVEAFLIDVCRSVGGCRRHGKFSLLRKNDFINSVDAVIHRKVVVGKKIFNW